MSSWYIEGGGNYIIKGEKTWGRKILIPIEEAETIRNRFKNIDAFGTVFAYDSKDQDTARMYGPLYLDLDLDIKTEADYQKVKKDLIHVITALNVMYYVPLENIRIYFSGHKGFHVMVDPEIFGIIPSRSLNEQYKAIALDLKKMTLFKTIDTGIYDKVRLLRFPNSINSATNLYKVPMDYDFVRKSTWEDIIEYASSPKEENFQESTLIHNAMIRFKETVKAYEETVKKNIRNNSPFMGNGNPRHILPCIKEMLNQPAEVGTRNRTTVIVASALCQSGIDFDKALEMINEWNDTHNSQKLSLREIKRTVESAYNEVNNGKAYGCRTIKEMGLCKPGRCRAAK
jgi:hypothetical protein